MCDESFKMYPCGGGKNEDCRKKCNECGKLAGCPHHYKPGDGVYTICFICMKYMCRERCRNWGGIMWDTGMRSRLAICSVKCYRIYEGMAGMTLSILVRKGDLPELPNEIIKIITDFIYMEENDSDSDDD